MPVVARAVRHRAVDVVRTADDEGLHQAVDHLVAVGHRRIAHIDGGRAPGAPGAAERRRGYRQAVRRHGLDAETRILPGGLTVPGGISVIGYDDSRLARLSHVNLTTVAQDAEQVTALAVTRAIDRLNRMPVDHRELVTPPRLVVRGTTAAVTATQD